MFGRAAKPSAGKQKPQRLSPPASIDLVWDETHAIAEAQERRHAALDGKAVPLLAFGLAFTAFLRTAPAVSLFDSASKDVLTGVVTIGLLGTLGAVLPRAWARVPDLTTFVRDANLDSARLKERYLRNYVNAYAHNERVLQRKFHWFKFAVFIYVVALAAGTVVTIWPLG